jgi:hypothetical protein
MNAEVYFFVIYFTMLSVSRTHSIKWQNDQWTEEIWKLPGGTEKAMKNLSQDSQWPSWDSNWALPEYKSRALLPHQLAWQHHCTDQRIFWYISPHFLVTHFRNSRNKIRISTCSDADHHNIPYFHLHSQTYNELVFYFFLDVSVTMAKRNLKNIISYIGNMVKGEGKVVPVLN